MKNETATSEKYVAGDGNAATTWPIVYAACNRQKTQLGARRRHNNKRTSYHIWYVYDGSLRVGSRNSSLSLSFCVCVPLSLYFCFSVSVFASLSLGINPSSGFRQPGCHTMIIILLRVLRTALARVSYVATAERVAVGSKRVARKKSDKSEGTSDSFGHRVSFGFGCSDFVRSITENRYPYPSGVEGMRVCV